MNVAFTDAGWEDDLWFQHDQPQLLERINEFIEGCSSVFTKPDRLRRKILKQNSLL